MKIYDQIEKAPAVIRMTAVGITALCMVFAPSAKACGNLTALASRSLNSLAPMTALGTMQASPQTGRATPEDQASAFPKIVGLWEVTFRAGGTLYDHAFQQMFGDGNETENSGFYPPEVGNVCVGIWKQQDARTFKLKHYGWLFDKGNFTGTLILTAIIRLGDSANTYSGTFVADVILPTGQTDSAQHAAGTLEAVRRE